MDREEFVKRYEALKQEGLVELQNWLEKKFDMAIRFTATDCCPICYLNAHPEATFGKFEHPDPAEVGFVWHVPGLSRWAYNTCYDPTRKMLQFYDVWFNLTYSEPFVTVVHEALHGFNCKSGNREYCGDISSAKDGELEEQAKKLVKEFLSQRTQ